MAYPTAVNNQITDAVNDQNIAAINDQITAAIVARADQIKQLQAEIGALQQAADALSGGAPTSPAKPPPEAKPKTGRKPMSAADRQLLSKRMKASWAKRRKAKG